MAHTAQERKTAKMFRELGLTVVEASGDQVKVSLLVPTFKGAATIETDLWVPLNNVAVLLEVTDANAKGVSSKLTKLETTLSHLRHGLDLCGASASKRRLFWTNVGIPGPQLSAFDDVETIVCTVYAESVITPPIQHHNGPRILCEQDCKRLTDYSRSVGAFGELTAAAAIGAELPAESEEIVIELLDAKRSRAPRRLVGLPPTLRAEAYLFFVNPFDILRYSRVARLEWLDQAIEMGSPAYQRPLEPSKIRRIRSELLDHGSEVLLPGSILAVLHHETEVKRNELHIRKVAGALEIIDGQHRLFAYADDAIAKQHKKLARIAVLALHFPDADAKSVQRACGQLFVDINDKQKRVPAAHIDRVGWPVLQIREPRYIAADVLSRLNARKGTWCEGLFFRTIGARTPIRPTTVRAAIQVGFPPQGLCGKKLNGVGTPTQRDLPLLRLMGLSEKKLVTPEAYVDAVSALLAKFLDGLKKACPADFEHLEDGLSVFGLSKGMAGVIRGLSMYAAQNGRLALGKQRDLAKDLLHLPVSLAGNIRAVTGNANPKARVLPMNHAKLPTAEAKQSEIVKFFLENFSRPTAFVTDDPTSV